jgi:hypothetical protein
VPARAAHELAGVVLTAANDAGDLVVRVLEDLAQQERRALDGRQPLEQGQERERQRIRKLGVLRRVGRPLITEQRL